MKKKLLILASIAPLFAFGQQATTFVGEGATVKVKPNTLYKNIGEFKVKEASSNQGKVSNEGNVNVQGNFTVSGDGKGFINEFENGASYGQLIIKNGKDVSGKMTGEYKFAPTLSFSYHIVAFPYVGYKASDAVSDAGITNANWKSTEAPVNQRYKSPLFVWNNRDYVSDNPQEMDVLNPTSAYSVNQYTYTGVADALHSFVGEPNNGDNKVSFPTYSLSGKKNTELNKYGEYYGSYIEDVTRAQPNGWTDFSQDVVLSGDNASYGSNLFTLGNPYTSNIDLRELTKSNKNVDAIVLEKSTSYFRKKGSAANEVVQKIISFFNGSSAPEGVIGDSGYGLIRPYQIFTLRTKANKGLDFTFGDNYKIFDIPNGLKGIELTPVARGSQFTSNTGSVYQVGMDLYENDNESGNRFYVVAADMYQAEGKSNYEAYNDWLGDNVGFYSLQEKEDGTISEDLSNQPVYINGVNASDYVAKPIHLVFQGKDNTPYTLKARLNEALLASGNKFYFEDKKEGKIMEVTKDFEYTFVENKVNKDRFVMYWNGLPDTMGTSDINTSQTIVYKLGEEYGVKFSEELNRADVYVYNLSGQLISSQKSINTDRDYILPYLAKSNVYIVKVVGDNGEVTTKKIIK